MLTSVVTGSGNSKDAFNFPSRAILKARAPVL